MLFFSIMFGCNRFKEQPETGNFAPEHIVQVSISIDEADWNELRFERRSFFSEFSGDCMSAPFSSPYNYYAADIVIDGEEQNNVGLRKKGFIGSQSTEKPSLKINVDEFELGAEIFGVDNITLNNSVQDPSLIRQCIGYQLFANIGYPAPQCNFAHVYVNGTDLGIYVHVEPIKRSFLRTHFDEDRGDLYEGTISDFQSLQYKTFEPKNDDTNPSLEPIIQLSEALFDSSIDLKEGLAEHIDIDMFITFWAMESILGHWDGYNGNRNNFYIYRAEDTGLFTFLPWGLDDVFDPKLLYDDSESFIFTSGALSNRMIEDPFFKEKLRQEQEHLMNIMWDEDSILSEIDRIESMLSSEVDLDEHRNDMNGVRTFVRERRENIEESLDPAAEELTPPYCIQEVGSIDATFETTWGTLDEEDPARVGTVDMDMIWDGELLSFQQIGSTVGTSEDNEGRDIIVLFGQLGDATYPYYIFPYLEYDQEQALRGEQFEIDSMNTWGNVLYTDASLGYQPVQAAMLHSGVLTFEEYSAEPNGIIKGSVSTKIHNWTEVTE